MPRTIDSTIQASLESVSRAELLLVFLTITDPNVAGPIRVVCEEDRGISTKNGKVINYYLDGALHYALPFSFSRLTDDERPARGQMSVPAFSSKIGDWLRTMQEPARLHVAIYAGSAWSDDVDAANNARNHAAAPELIYNANHMFLRSASGGMTAIDAEVGGYDFTQEPLGPRATKTLCPDIYR
jgi:hypothetical protein